MTAPSAPTGFNNEREAFMSLDTSAIGAAGEYLVCADMIMHGFRAWQAPNSFSYDVISEINGRLVRVSVKSTLQPRHRPGRIASKQCYRWRLARSVPRRERSAIRPYTESLTDIIAVVALDTKLIGYLPVNDFPMTLEIEAPHGLPSAGRYGPRELKLRTFAEFSLASAIDRLPPLAEMT